MPVEGSLFQKETRPLKRRVREPPAPVMRPKAVSFRLAFGLLN